MIAIAWSNHLVLYQDDLRIRSQLSIGSLNNDRLIDTSAFTKVKFALAISAPASSSLWGCDEWFYRNKIWSQVEGNFRHETFTYCYDKRLILKQSYQA